jgi:hypothetical protein
LSPGTGGGPACSGQGRGRARHRIDDIDDRGCPWTGDATSPNAVRQPTSARSESPRPPTRLARTSDEVADQARPQLVRRPPQVPSCPLYRRKTSQPGPNRKQQVVAEPPAHAAVARGTAGRADGARPVTGRGEVQAGSAEHDHPLIRMHTRGGPPEAEEGDQSACESSAVPYAPGRLRSRPGSRWRPVRHPPCRDPRTERYRLPARVITY